MKRSSKSGAGDSRGIALIMVIWLLVILLVLASEFVISARSDLETVINYKEDRETYFLAYSGIQMAMTEIMQGADYHHYHPGGKQLVFAKEGDEENKVEFAPREGVRIGDGIVSYTIEDASTRINLNNVARSEGNLKGLVERLFGEKLENRDLLVDSILDWTDIDDDYRANGAEKDYYGMLFPPYGAKNGDFDTVSELLKVKGVTEDVYKVMGPLLTVYPVMNLNVNTAPAEVLAANGASPEDLEEIMKARSEKGYFSKGARTNLFIVTSTGSFGENGLRHTIRAVIQQIWPRWLKIIEWKDDYYEPEPLYLENADEEEKE